MRSFLLGAIAGFVVAGVVGGLIAIERATAHENAEASAAPDVTAVVGLARDVPPGHVLTADELVMLDFPTELMVGPYAQLMTDAEAVAGRTAATELLAGEPLMAERLSPDLEQSGLAAVTPEGTVRMVLHLGNPEALPTLAPGNYVDVVVGPDKGIWRDLQVLVVDHERRRITVLAEPRAQRNLQAAIGAGGPPIAVLRNDVDVTQVVNNPPLDWNGPE